MSLIQIRNLTFAYPGSYDNVFSGLDLRFDTNWKLGLTGRNGRGKTTLLRLLAGQLTHSGQIDARTAFAYFPFPVSAPDLPVEELPAVFARCRTGRSAGNWGCWDWLPM